MVAKGGAKKGGGKPLAREKNIKEGRDLGERHKDNGKGGNF